MTDPATTYIDTAPALKPTPASKPTATPVPALGITGKTSIEQAIANAAKSTDVDFDYLVAQAQVESAMNPQARARSSSATGLYQFIESTWLETMKRHGARFGLGDVADQISLTGKGSANVADPAQRAAILNLRNDPQVSSLMAAGLAQDNSSALMPILGRQPDSGELYLAHFLGAGGAGRFLSAMQADPDQSAASLFRRPAAANRAVFYGPGGQPRSLAGVMDYLGAKLQSALPAGGASAGQAPYRSLTGTAPDPASGYAPPANPVPDLIPADEVFDPANPPASTSTAWPRIMPAATLSLPPAPGRPLAQRATGQSMSDLLGASYKASGAADLASPATTQTVERAYSQLRALGL